MSPTRPHSLRAVLSAGAALLALAACTPAGMAPAAVDARSTGGATSRAAQGSPAASRPAAAAAGTGASAGSAPASPTSTLTSTVTSTVTAAASSSPSSSPSSSSSSAASTPTGRAAAGASPTPRTAASGPAGTGSGLPAIAPVNPACGPSLGVVSRAPGSGRTVALTFDDGPDARYTGRILQILAAHGVHATFFDTGAHDAAEPGLAARIVASGNLLGNHSWDHPKNLGFGSAASQASEISRTSAEQQRITGSAPCWFRPPGGAYDATTVALARAARLSIAMWSVDTEDWRQSAALTPTSTAAIVRNARAGLSQQHPVVLMHTAKASHEPESQVAAERENTIAALPQIIEMYRAAGYRFVLL